MYHKFDTTFKLRILGLGKVKKVKPMTEEAAIDLASDMLGETIIFTVGAGCIYLEYLRQMHKDRNKEDFQNLRLNELETRVQVGQVMIHHLPMAERVGCGTPCLL